MGPVPHSFVSLKVWNSYPQVGGNKQRVLPVGLLPVRIWRILIKIIVNIDQILIMGHAMLVIYLHVSLKYTPPL